MADIEAKNMAQTEKNIAKILKEEIRRLSEKYDIQPNDIRFANLDKDLKAVDIVYSSPSGSEITLSQMREGEIRPLKEEIKKQTDIEMQYEKELNSHLREAYEKAGEKLDESNKNGTVYKSVCEAIRHEHDAYIEEKIGRDEYEIRQDVKNIKQNFKELPKDKGLKAIQKEQIKAVKNRQYEEIDKEIAGADKNIKDLEGQLEKLYQRARKEIVTARTLGAPEKQCTMSLETADMIKDRTMKLTKERARLEKALNAEKQAKSLKGRAWRWLKETAHNGKTVISDSGRKALAMIADEVHNRSAIARTKGVIAYQGMGAKVSQIGRGFNLRCYAADMQRVAELEKAKAKLIAQIKQPDMKKAEKKAARVNISRNIKAFFKGKAPEGQEVTAKDIAKAERDRLIEELNEEIRYYKDDARDCLDIVQKNAEKTAESISRTTGARDFLQIGDKGYLDEALKTARQQAAKANAGRVQLDRSDKTTDIGEKIR